MSDIGGALHLRSPPFSFPVLLFNLNINQAQPRTAQATLGLINAIVKWDSVFRLDVYPSVLNCSCYGQCPNTQRPIFREWESTTEKRLGYKEDRSE